MADSKEGGGQAFPEAYQPGMTLRDYFAAKAMVVILEDYIWAARHPDESGAALDETPVRSVSTEAYALADAMLAARGQ